MHEEERKRAEGVTPSARRPAAGPGILQRHQQLRGPAGQLRPYRDVRAGFAPWRRLALATWAEHDDRGPAH